MKKIIFCFSLIIFSATFAFSQMTDEQVISYVKGEHAKGTSQQVIATNLVNRGVTKAQLEKIKQQQEEKQLSEGVSKKSSTQLNRERLNPETRDIPSGSLEEVENEFADGDKIFGKNIFKTKNLSFTPSLNIPTPSDYKLGAGDEVIIDVWGASQTSVAKTISPEGSITVDRLGPIYLNGMSIKEANSHIQRKFSSIYSGLDHDGGASQVKLTLGQIRTIQINVMGEVTMPGTYSLTSLSSVFHALYSAGGVNNIGSLREVKLYRNGKLLHTMDIYQYILEGKLDTDVRMADGDVIIVPTYTSLVEITGGVKRPMTYETTTKETVADLISYAGGFKGDAYIESVRILRKTGNDNKIFTLNKDKYSTFLLEDSDLVFISSGLDLYENRVEIKGAVFRAGYYEIGKGVSSVKQLIERADGLRGDAFLNRAVLTREKEDLTTEVISINIDNLINKNGQDIALKKNDILYIPSINDLMEVGDIVINGFVARPGNYKFSENTTLEDIIVQAGGLLEAASTVKVDVARRIMNSKALTENRILAQNFTFSVKDGYVVDGEQGFILKPSDQIYIRKSPGYHEQRNVILEGEVLFAGSYAISKKSERLSELIKRAGNLTMDAYPKGARLIRKKNTQDQLKDKIKLDMIKRQSSKDKDSISLESLELEDASYSIGIELEKAIANPNSDFDIVLQAEDIIIVPEYDNTVRIAGAVMFPNTVMYKKGEKLSYYINQAGGYATNAKKNKSFVVYMNGTVSKAKKTDKNAVLPGAEIIVPTKGERKGMSIGEIVSIGTSVTSMASVVALLINSLTTK